MSQSLVKFPFATNNNARPQAEPYLREISKEGDFTDLLKYSPQRELFALKSKLEATVRGFGDIRNPLVDMCRMRLTRLRQHLA